MVRVIYFIIILLITIISFIVCHTKKNRFDYDMSRIGSVLISFEELERTYKAETHDLAEDSFHVRNKYGSEIKVAMSTYSDYLKYKNFYREHREEMEKKKSAKDIRKYRSWIGESEGKER